MLPSVYHRAAAALCMLAPNAALRAFDWAVRYQTAAFYLAMKKQTHAAKTNGQKGGKRPKLCVVLAGTLQYGAVGEEMVNCQRTGA